MNDGPPSFGRWFSYSHANSPYNIYLISVEVVAGMGLVYIMFQLFALCCCKKKGRGTAHGIGYRQNNPGKFATVSAMYQWLQAKADIELPTGSVNDEII